MGLQWKRRIFDKKKLGPTNFGLKRNWVKRFASKRISDPKVLVKEKLVQKNGKTSKIVGLHPAKKRPMLPPLDYFQGKNKNCSSLARTISLSRRSFFAYLTTFERRSGLKKFAILKITILKMGFLSKFQSHRSWEDAHLSLGAAQAPP